MEWITAARSSLPLHYHALPPLLLLAAISALVLLRKAITGRTKSWPPGPPAWPIIGHLHLLGQLPHQSLCKLSHSYGPLMGLRLGGVPTIVASSPEMAKEILQTHDLAFAYRPPLAVGKHVGFHWTDVTFAPYGPYWKSLRRLYSTNLLSSKQLDASRHVRDQEMALLMRDVLREGGQGDVRVKLRPLLFMTSNNIICRMVMGKRITEVYAKDAKLDMMSLIDEVLHLAGVFYVGDYIPWLSWLDPYGYLKHMTAVAEKVKSLLQHVIDKRREEYLHMQHNKQEEHELPPRDFLDALLASSHNKDLDMQMTDENIMAAILDIFLAGSDTSTIAVEWAMADLITNPKVMLKVQEELDKVVGKRRRVGESDIVNLPYLGSVVKESMRLHPVVPLLIPHEGVQDCQIGGYKISSKTRAYVNVWAIGRDPLTWDHPIAFLPERFDKINLDLRGKNFELLPFGSGRRKCPGWALGLINVQLMLASLIQAFAWSIDTPSCPNDCSHIDMLDMSERFALVSSMAKPLQAFATPRLPMNFY